MTSVIAPGRSTFRFPVLSSSIVIVLWVLIILIPLGWEVGIAPSAIGLVQGWQGVTVRSLGISAAATIISILVSVVVVLMIYRQGLRQKYALLLAPILIGETAGGFCWHLWYQRGLGIFPLLESRDPLAVCLALIAFQSWVLMPICILILLLCFDGYSREYDDFRDFYSLRPWEVGEYIAWRRIAAGVGVLSLLGIAMGATEQAASQVLLKPGPGTDTELFSHLVGRAYSLLSKSEFGPEFARDLVLSMSAWVSITVLILAALVAPVLILSIKFIFFQLSRIDRRWNFRWRPMRFRRERSAWQPGELVASFVVVLYLLPLGAPLLWLRFSEIDLGFPLLSAVSWSMLGAIAPTALAVFFLFAVRSYNAGSRWGRSVPSVAIILSLLVLTIPPRGFETAGFRVLEALGAKGELLGTLLWMLGQGLNALPVVIAFGYLSILRVPRAEVDLIKVSGGRVFDSLRVSFVARLWPDLILLFLVATLLVFTESSLNSVLDGLTPHIPTLGPRLASLVDGRGASYFEAATLLAGLYVVTFLALVGWAKSAIGRRSNSSPRTGVGTIRRWR